MTENEEEVTPEQTDLIVQYSQITGHEDLDKCKDHLKVKKVIFITSSDIIILYKIHPAPILTIE